MSAGKKDVIDARRLAVPLRLHNCSKTAAPLVTRASRPHLTVVAQSPSAVIFRTPDILPRNAGVPPALSSVPPAACRHSTLYRVPCPRPRGHVFAGRIRLCPMRSSFTFLLFTFFNHCPPVPSYHRALVLSSPPQPHPGGLKRSRNIP